MKTPEFIVEKLDKLRSIEQFRELKLSSQNQVDFSSNDYLGFAKNTNQVKNIFIGGSTGSRLLRGNLTAHEELEQYAADFFHSESALFFNSAYNANLAIFSSIPQRNHHILYDSGIHASTKDGMRLSFAQKTSFKHNDIEDFSRKLKRLSGIVFVALESVYSMDGDLCKLVDFVEICEQRPETYIILDEAHAIGIYGEDGSGLANLLNVEDKIFCRIQAFGKAIGVCGAIVNSSQQVKNFLINHARSFIYTTALPEIVAISALKNLKNLKKANENRKKLHELISFTNKTFQNIPKLDFRAESAIIPIIIPGNPWVKDIAEELQKNNFDIRAILSPSVPRNTERLRMILHSFNTEKEIKDFSNILKKLI